MLRFLLGLLLLGTLLFRGLFIIPVDVPVAMHWPWFCDKPCPKKVAHKNFSTFIPTLLSQHVDMHDACRNFCDVRNNVWKQLQIPAEEVQNLYTSSAKFAVSLMRRNDPTFIAMTQVLSFVSFPIQVLYFLAVFLCSGCARFLNKLVLLNVLLALGGAGFHVYRMYVAARGELDPLAVAAEVGFDGALVPLILLLLIVTTPKKVTRAAKNSRKQKSKVN